MARTVVCSFSPLGTFSVISVLSLGMSCPLLSRLRHRERSLCGESLEPVHGLGQLLLHEMAGLGFIQASPVHLDPEHDLGEVVCSQ